MTQAYSRWFPEDNKPIAVLLDSRDFFVLALLQHIEALLQDRSARLPADILDWYKEAKEAAQEYARMEEALYPILKKAPKIFNKF